ncbi:MAG: lytic transglycosylase domain-containing protein [Clostridia bacterium]|nr:lytic transglycosylase domain-containing protein [Clostridia bacterium]
MKKHSKFPRHVIAVCVILVLSILIGFAFDGAMTLIERHTHPREYRTLIETYAAEYGVPTSVVYAVIKSESDFDPAAISSAGAIGLMQLMPDTFEWLCSRTGDLYAPALLYDPATNIRYGTYLLSILYTEYGTWETVYAAYNAGIGNVNAWLEDPEYSDGNGNLTYIPFKETRAYVKRVKENREMYERLYADTEITT